ncbi:MAG: tRNA preQ1(34) S-adenosylmethionine ribosyltransferase-isomerase QueA [Proteobacteria bacterium]|nr:tRNA preQ1(34) S-adenosylmethionine ribosyltransferase-isomerase QueA [Pseudomonadota bacterium]
MATYDFDLPRDLIAERPAVPRDSARLLHVGSGLADRRIFDLPDQLRPGDLLVVNDTRVIPARLAGRRGEARIEATLVKTLGPSEWRAFARPARRLRPGDRIDFAADFTGDFGAEVIGKGEGGLVDLRFDCSGDALRAAMERHGEMPLPPYIARPEGPDARDRADYQTVYAAREGAVAAPTAGLHFTDELFAALEARGIGRAVVTLHVGPGTFLPVKVEDLRSHAMHAEWGEISTETAERIAATRAAGGRIVAVGTTSLRLLESAAGEDGVVRPYQGETSIFIMPGRPIRSADMLLTNFHLPRSTLFVLVCAFAGTERMKAAYSHAIASGYRFYSYGDACLLERAE